MAGQSKSDDIFVVISELTWWLGNWISRGSCLKKDDSWADRQMTDLIFRDTLLCIFIFPWRCSSMIRPLLFVCLSPCHPLAWSPTYRGYRPPHNHRWSKVNIALSNYAQRQVPLPYPQQTINSAICSPRFSFRNGMQREISMRIRRTWTRFKNRRLNQKSRGVPRLGDVWALKIIIRRSSRLDKLSWREGEFFGLIFQFCHY